MSALGDDCVRNSEEPLISSSPNARIYDPQIAEQSVQRRKPSAMATPLKSALASSSRAARMKSPVSTSNPPAPPGTPASDRGMNDSPESISPSPLSPNSSSPPQSKERQTRNIWKQLSPTLVLENQGSVARDHLASERTFLAYVRTSIAIASTGVALVQLFSIATESSDNNMTHFYLRKPDIAKYAKPLGAATTAFGLVVLGMGLYRYFSVQKALVNGVFPVARFGLMALTVVMAAVVAIVFGVLVTQNRS